MLKRFFYGWTMVGASCLMQFVQGTLLLQSFGAYFAALRDDRGWTKTELSAAAAMHQMEAAILGPLLGWFIDRFGPQWVIRVGVVVFGLGFIGLSYIDTLVQFYVAFIVTALGASLCGYFPLTVSLILWFEKHRARAISAMQLGMAAGGLSLPLVAWSLVSFGWRTTAFASGVLIIAICLPLSFMMRRRPEDYGLRMDGAPAPAADGSDAPAGAAAPVAGPADDERDFTVREAVRTPAFWLISLGHGFALFAVMAINTHAITHMKEGLGYTIEQAAFAITLQTVAQLAGVGMGVLIGDRYNKRVLSAFCMLGHAAGMVFLTFATGWGMIVAYAILHGAAWGLRGPFMQALRADYFGRKAIGMILGVSFMITVIGQIGGPMIAGILADFTGDYRMGFSVIAALAALGSLFFVFARKPPIPARISAIP